MLFRSEAKYVNATGYEPAPDIRADKALRDRLECVRQAAAEAIGFVKPGESALEKSPILPIIAMVAPARDYIDYGSGNTVRGEDMDFAARNLFNQMPTDTFPTTATFCITVAAQIEGTVVNKVCKERAHAEKLVRFGHSRGINAVEADVDNTPDGPVVKKAIFKRTARRILDGIVYVRKSVIES